MKPTNDLTKFALTGHSGITNPHIYSSPAWYAHQLGALLGVEPRDVRMGRGDSIRANGMRFTFRGNARTITFVRVE